MRRERATKRKPSPEEGNTPFMSFSPQSMGVLDDIAHLQETEGNRAAQHILAQAMQWKRLPGAGRLTLPAGDRLPVKRRRIVLPDAVQTKMEQAFEEDFSHIKIQEDSTTRTIGAMTYVRGDRIFLAPGKYQPHTQSGQELIGHALAYTLQQRQKRVKKTGYLLGAPVNEERMLEREAEEWGRRAARYVPPTQKRATPERKPNESAGTFSRPKESPAGKRAKNPAYPSHFAAMAGSAAKWLTMNDSDQPGAEARSEGSSKTNAQTIAAAGIIAAGGMAGSMYRKLKKVRGTGRKKHAARLYQMAIGQGEEAAQAKLLLIDMGILKKDEKSPGLYKMDDLAKEEKGVIQAILYSLKSRLARRSKRQ